MPKTCVYFLWPTCPRQFSMTVCLCTRDWWPAILFCSLLCVEGTGLLNLVYMVRVLHRVLRWRSICDLDHFKEALLQSVNDFNILWKWQTGLLGSPGIISVQLEVFLGNWIHYWIGPPEYLAPHVRWTENEWVLCPLPGRPWFSWFLSTPYLLPHLSLLQLSWTEV